jgi:hypothetical protein
VAGASQLPAVIENQKIFKGPMTRDYLVSGWSAELQLLDIQWLKPANLQ